MLFIKTKNSFRRVLQGAYMPLVLLPASVPGESREVSKTRTNDLAVDARIAGFGVTVVESKDGELFVMASSNESQVVGLGRKMLQETRTAQPWFLLLRTENGPLLKENADRNREECPLSTNSFVLSDGRTVEIVASYVPAQNNTALLYSRGWKGEETLG